MKQVNLQHKACGLTNVHSFEQLTGTAYVVGWTLTPEGKVEPEYSGETEVNWDDQKPDPATPYYCEHCGVVFGADELAIGPTTDEDEDA